MKKRENLNLKMENKMQKIKLQNVSKAIRKKDIQDIFLVNYISREF